MGVRFAREPTHCLRSCRLSLFPGSAIRCLPSACRDPVAHDLLGNCRDFGRRGWRLRHKHSVGFSVDVLRLSSATRRRPFERPSLSVVADSGSSTHAGESHSRAFAREVSVLDSLAENDTSPGSLAYR